MQDNLTKIQQNNQGRKVPTTYVYLPPEIVAIIGFQRDELVRVRAVGKDAVIVERIRITPVNTSRE